MILLPLFLRDYASLKTVLGRPLDPAYQRTVLIIYGILHMVEGLLLLQLSPIGWALALATTCMGILGNLSAGFASAGLQSSPTGVSPGIGATLAWGPLLTGVIILLYLFYTRSLFSETASGSRIEGFRDAPDSPTPRSGPRGSTPE